MKIQFNSLSKQTGNAAKNFKKVAITATAVTTLTLGAGVHASADTSLKTVYHVYVDDQYIGMITDKEKLDKIVAEKVNKSKEALENPLALNLEPNLTYIPEQVFESISNADEIKVLEKMESLLALEAEAAELVIDDKNSVYVKDNKAAEQVIEALKLKYVTKEQLEQIETQKEKDVKLLPPLKENETRIIDVRLSKNISLNEANISPKKILTVDKAVEYIQKGTLEEKTYQVKKGDVLSQIASDHDMTLEQLYSLNPELEEDSFLKIGQPLNVTILEPLIEVIVDKEVLKKEVISYSKEVETDAAMYKGDSKVVQEGKDGSKKVTYQISEQNGKIISQESLNEAVIEEPITMKVIKGTKVIPSRGEGSFAWPAVGGYISSKQGQRWGKLHKGIDIARPSDLTIKASDNGVVKFAGNSGGYGNKVVIDHQNGYETLYAHLSSITVNVGQTVSKGMQIGVMGSTGNSTGVHLHFEIYKNGNLENPLDYVR